MGEQTSGDLMFVALPCIGWAVAVLCMAVLSVRIGTPLRVNMLCATGVLLCAIGIGMGWGYGRGDVGMSSGWPIVILLGCYISLVSPLGGFVQVLALLADIGVAYDSEMGVSAGLEWIALAVLGSAIVLGSLVLPLGVRTGPRITHDTKGRLLTISVARR